MPQGAQSLVPLNSTDFTAVDGTTYKGNIDAFTAVASQISGPFYVYPSSPASMVVKIDAAYTYFNIGIPATINSTTQASLTLAAPGSNSRYGTVFWDFTTNAPGVAYSTSAVSPVPILPESLNQIPLAIVLIASTATSLTAANIEDIRGFNSFSGPLSKNIGNFTTAAQQITQNVSGANYISIFCGRTSTANTTSSNVILTNYRIGTPIFLRFDNGVAGTITFTLYCISPVGTVLSVQEKGFGGSTGAVIIGGTGATGIAVPTGTAITLTGNSIPGLVDLNGS